MRALSTGSTSSPLKMVLDAVYAALVLVEVSQEGAGEAGQAS